LKKASKLSALIISKAEKCSYICSRFWVNKL